MKCRYCGASVSGQSGFCPQCGAMVGRKQPGLLRCSRCGRRVPASGHLCPACGAELRRSRRWLLLTVLALAVVSGSYYVTTQVVTLQRIRIELARLKKLSVGSLLPQPTPTFTPAPTQTSEARPTPTRIPTATPAPSPMPTTSPTLTETLSAGPPATAAAAATSAGPSATASTGLPYGQVVLLGPASGSVLEGDALVLSWQPAGELAEDEWYLVSLRYRAGEQVQYGGTWVKDTSWQVPVGYRGKADVAKPDFEWDVRVIRQVTSADGRTEGMPLSPVSETRTFTWR